MLLAGSLCYSFLLAPGRYRSKLLHRLCPLLVVSTFGSFIAAILILSLQTALMSGDWHNVAKSDIWLAVLSTHFGEAWRWQLLFSLAAPILAVRRSLASHASLLLISTAQLCGLAFTGHAAIHQGWIGALQQTNQALHLLAAAFWLGGMITLLMSIKDITDIMLRMDVIRAMMRFSRYGHGAVIIIVMTGLINIRLILNGGLDFSARYSQLLMMKIALVAIMIIIALLNRYYLVPRFSLAGRHPLRLFILMTRLELFLAAVVLLLVSTFATLQPA